ncbi:metallophosphoesterase family protein [Paenibacillus aceris]|uniref:Serine/threonine protein phosphatase 1 n=1 Tax=Paenibacillus aceris TaxID=869555 RepID=A0ABS4I4S6_9BACL|nr:metallophosphoesterase family protein [Paenibacillus aceris]MBP1965932.1 serine/threonine protein phosphatase 1 [Paenibacillus aceris]NHW35070.1 serine/threonine protein phosphatase [Paenibacillus aceris]
MKRTLVVSDIHGCVDEFKQLLVKVNFNAEEDQLVLLGDYVDRGPDSRGAVEYVMSLVREKGAIALKGNHDQRFVDVLGEVDPLTEMKFFEHGGIQTFQSFCGSNNLDLKQSKERILGTCRDHIDFLSSLPLFHEDEGHIYVHAGLNPTYIDWKTQPERDFLWIRAPFVQQRTVVKKTVVFGHTPAKDIHGKADVWFDRDKIGIDGGCAYGFQINCLEIKGNNQYTTHSVASKGSWK